MIQTLIVFALLAIQPPAPAPDITVPATVSLRNGHIAKVTPTTTLSSVKWINLNADLDIIDSGLGWVIINAHVGDTGVCRGGKLTGNVASYQIGVYGAKLSADGKSAIATDPTYITVNVTIPGPPPPPPPPPSALVQAVQTAYTTDKATDPAAAMELTGLAKVYSYLASTAGIGNVTTVTDWSQVTALAEQQATANGVSGKLIATQTAVAQAFVAAVPAAASGSGPIAAADRAAATAFFTQAAAACGQVTR